MGRGAGTLWTSPGLAQWRSRAPGWDVRVRRARPSGDSLPRVTGRSDLPALRTVVRAHEGLHGAEGRFARPFSRECGERGRVPGERRRLSKAPLCL